MDNIGEGVLNIFDQLKTRIVIFNSIFRQAYV